MNDRFNTIAGWTLFAGIVALGLSAISARIYHADSHDAPDVAGFPIEGAEDEGGADAGPDLGTLLAAADADAGERSFAKCVSCHTIDQGGAHGIGPNLWGVLGTGIGQHAAGFAYSSALSGHGGTWTYEAMDDWLANPGRFAPGTKMSFAGLSRPEERANVIAYMRAHGGGPEYPAPAAPAAPEVTGPDVGPGDVEGGAVDPSQAVDAMGMPRPAPQADAAVGNVGE
jgi:cytochrome c